MTPTIHRQHLYMTHLSFKTFLRKYLSIAHKLAQTAHSQQQLIPVPVPDNIVQFIFRQESSGDIRPKLRANASFRC